MIAELGRIHGTTLPVTVVALRPERRGGVPRPAGRCGGRRATSSWRAARSAPPTSPARSLGRRLTRPEAPGDRRRCASRPSVRSTPRSAPPSPPCGRVDRARRRAGRRHPRPRRRRGASPAAGSPGRRRARRLARSRRGGAPPRPRDPLRPRGRGRGRDVGVAETLDGVQPGDAAVVIAALPRDAAPTSRSAGDVVARRWRRCRSPARCSPAPPPAPRSPSLSASATPPPMRRAAAPWPSRSSRCRPATACCRI